MLARKQRLALAAALVATLMFAAGGDAAPGGDTAPQQAPGVLVSRQLASSRQLHVGGLIRLASKPSGGLAQPFRIEGIYEPVADPMRFAQSHFEVRLHLPDLLALTGDPSSPDAADTVSSINVALADRSRAAAFAADLSARLPGTVATPVTATDDRTSTFIVIERFHLAIAIVSVTGSAVFLLALMVMLVDERRETIGMLRLIGFTRRRILIQVVVEGALISVAGTAFGLGFALVSERAFNHFFQWRYDTSLIFLRITPAVVAQSALIALPLGIAASLLASWTSLHRGLLALVRR